MARNKQHCEYTNFIRTRLNNWFERLDIRDSNLRNVSVNAKGSFISFTKGLKMGAKFTLSYYVPQIDGEPIFSEFVNNITIKIL